MLLLRKILFYLFLAIYLVSCPVLILYTLGITVKPKTQTIQKTGLIHLTTLPPGARIYINGRAFKEKTPATVRNLSPQHYVIRLVKKNYRSWARLLPVRGEKATAVENILLLPKVWRPHPLSSLALENILSPQGQPFLLLRSDPYLSGVSVLPLNELNTQRTTGETSKEPRAAASFKPLLLPEETLRNSRIKRTFSVAQSWLVVLEVESDKQLRYFWLDLHASEPAVKDITDLFPQPPETITWDPQENRILFALNKNAIDQLDTNAMAIYPKIIEDVSSFSVYNRHLYVLSRSQLIKRFDYNGKNPETLLEDSDLGKELFGDDATWQITVLFGDTMIFSNNRGAIATNVPPRLLVSRDVKGFEFDEDTKRLLLWTDKQLGVVDFIKIKPSKEMPDMLAETGAHLTWLTKKAKDIQQAFWVNKGRYVLARDSNSLFLIEAFKKYRSAKINEITGIQTRGPAAYSEKAGALFYLDARTKILTSLEIMPSEKEEPERSGKQKKVKNEI